jgi:hypothetical protein
LIPLYIKWRQAKTNWGVSGRGRERDREEQINGVRDVALERIRNGMGLEMTVGKMTPEYFK